MAIGNDTQPTLDEIRAQTIDRVGDFRSTLKDFAKRIAAVAKEFDPDSWELDKADVTYDDLDNFHIGLQAEMTSLDADYEDLKTSVFDLEDNLTTWGDIKDEEETCTLCGKPAPDHDSDCRYNSPPWESDHND